MQPCWAARSTIGYRSSILAESLANHELPLLLEELTAPNPHIYRLCSGAAWLGEGSRHFRAFLVHVFECVNLTFYLRQSIYTPFPVSSSRTSSKIPGQ